MKKLFLLAIFLLIIYFFWEGTKKIYHFAMDEVVLPQIDQQEQALGQQMLDDILKNEVVIQNTLANKALDTIRQRLSKGQKTPIKLYLIQKKEVNAFAMPGNTIVVYTGLMKSVTSAEAVAGVLAHEMGHVQLKHVRNKVIKELGISLAFSLLLGESQNMLTQLIKQMGSTAFDRNQEEDADSYAARLLEKNQVSLVPFMEFFFKLSDNEDNRQIAFSLLSTHPNSESRALRIENYALKHPFRHINILKMSWKRVLDSIK